MTPAIKLLQKTGAAHQVVSYDHDPAAESYGIEAASALGLDPSMVFKTLLATVDGAETVVAVLPVASKLDLKALARAAGAKKAAMADPDDAERLTGYVVGGISPLGQRRRLRTFIDESAVGLDVMNVSGGKRGLGLALAPAVLAQLCEAHYGPLAVTSSANSTSTRGS